MILFNFPCNGNVECVLFSRVCPLFWITFISGVILLAIVGSRKGLICSFALYVASIYHMLGVGGSDVE